MTPAEVAALRERLKAVAQQMNGHPGTKWWSNTAADLRAALALLDAQAAEIARLTAERERARAALEEIADRHIGDQPASSPLSEEAWARRCNVELRRIAIRALAPAPAAEVA